MSAGWIASKCPPNLQNVLNTWMPTLELKMLGCCHLGQQEGAEPEESSEDPLIYDAAAQQAQREARA